MKKYFNSTFLIVVGMLILALTLSGCLSLSQDITPPPTEPISPASTEQVDDLQPTQEPTPEPTPEVVEEPTAAGGATPGESSPQETETRAGTVVVSLKNQGAGSWEGAQVTVELEGYDHMTPVFTRSVQVAAGEQAVFEEVPFQAGRMFLASVSYQGAVYRSDVAEVEPELEEMDLEVNVFGTTTDTTGLSVDRVHIFLDFPQADLLQVGEMFVISNLGEQTVVAEEQGGAVVEFPLPTGAANLSFQNRALGERFVRTEEGFGDTASIPPGSGVYQVMVFYTLPYQEARIDFEQRMPYPVGAAVLITPVGDVRLRGSGVQDMGVRQVQNGAIQVYAQESLSAGESLRFILSGRPDHGAAFAGGAENGVRRELLIGIGVLGVILLGIGVWYFLRFRKRQPAAQPTAGQEQIRENLLDSIIALDDLFKSGEINEEDYHKRRKRLKSRLQDVIRQEE